MEKYGSPEHLLTQPHGDRGVCRFLQRVGEVAQLPLMSLAPLVLVILWLSITAENAVSRLGQGAVVCVQAGTECITFRIHQICCLADLLVPG